MLNQDKLLSDIQYEVLGYLNEHPEAFDTVEGISQWWLLRRLAQFSTERVQAAIDQLVSAGLIEAHLLDDGQQAYCRCLKTDANPKIRRSVMNS